MNYKKVALLGIMCFSLLCPLSVQAQNHTDTSKIEQQQQLTDKEIQEKLSLIGNKYRVGELLSEEDANFVRTYAKQPSHPSEFALFKTATFTGSYGNVELTGTGTVDLGIINNSTQGSFIVRDTKKNYHKTIGSVAELRCFGVFGEGGTGIGLVYSKDYKNESTNANYNKNSFSDNFVASVAYYTFEVRGLVDGNSFSTTAND
ncbi:hypothetical protein ABD76_21255 [Paenibacillus dendritiformis]|uniref:hypothetical protein n=1 Tax=Paenibacillus dendritiformis TaxID=130049 RepID=UPI0018CE066F|nr:hypothetical protein [Paenibacillus dendritiformis]MBG9794864.1 hypothetical protein [Paenibacillus dendritiformis]